jgi:hypothetical protein
MIGTARPIGTTILLLVAVTPLRALSADGVPAPLFASDDEIALTLELPLRTLLRQRTRHPDVEGTLVVDETAAAPPLPVEVTTRGHNRLDVCAFPPLRLSVRREQAAGTLFAGQNRLKLVTLCRDSESYANYLRLEHFAYRMYAELSEAAFRVRPIHARYVDTERDGEAYTAPAFFVEPIGGVAARLGWQAIDAPRLRYEQLEPGALARLALFQFMIGNTDWAVTQPTLGEDTCCHNADVLAPVPDRTAALVLVPFDFDSAGLVDAVYAKPDERLGIRSVRERLYRGFCATNGYLDETIAAFNAARPAIEALLDDQPLAPKAQAAAAAYLARSYEIINDEREKQRQILSRCLET